MIHWTPDSSHAMKHYFSLFLDPPFQPVLNMQSPNRHHLPTIFAKRLRSAHTMRNNELWKIGTFAFLLFLHLNWLINISTWARVCSPTTPFCRLLLLLLLFPASSPNFLRHRYILWTPDRGPQIIADIDKRPSWFRRRNRAARSGIYITSHQRAVDTSSCISMAWNANPFSRRAPSFCSANNVIQSKKRSNNNAPNISPADKKDHPNRNSHNYHEKY